MHFDNSLWFIVMCFRIRPIQYIDIVGCDIFYAVYVLPWSSKQSYTVST